MDFASNLGEMFLRWSIRLAVACYVGRLVIDLGTFRAAGRMRYSRWLWSLGCGLLLVHVAAAFHFVHDWSHRQAYDHTARQTAEVMGLAWGGGLYANYGFMLLWTVDTLAWWFAPEVHNRAKWWHCFVHAVFALIMVNATAVFGPPFWKGVAAAVAVGLVCLYGWVHRRGGLLWEIFKNSR